MESCKECYHYEVCRMHYQQKCELTYETEKEVRRAMLEAEKGNPICDHFKDRSRFVELPCDIISKAEIKRELSAQCAVKKIDVETAKDMLENLPYIRVNTKQELKERETIPNNITPEATIIELNRCKVNGFMPVDVDRRGRAIERAKAALRKQVPMKVGYDDSMSPGFPAVRCGRCTELVEKEYSTARLADRLLIGLTNPQSTAPLLFLISFIQFHNRLRANTYPRRGEGWR